MGKAKTSKKRSGSLRKSGPVVLKRHKVLDERVLDKETLKSALIEALIDGDIETLKDILVAQIRIANKTDLVRRSKLGRQTLYDLIDDKREFNPTIKTLSSILKAIAA